jgi:hypothetical protein
MLLHIMLILFFYCFLKPPSKEREMNVAEREREKRVMIKKEEGRTSLITFNFSSFLGKRYPNF